MATIDCADCCMRNTNVCDDCVVTFVMSREPGEALVIEAAEARAVRMLASAGLVPELRHTAAPTNVGDADSRSAARRLRAG